jgi:hypothetical protein
MLGMFRSVAAFGSILLAASATAAHAAADECAAMDYLLAQARTEFPQLADKRLNFGRCSLVKQEFTCSWDFGSDRYAAAQDEAAKLAECTAAQPGATGLKGKRGEVGYQINSETSVFIRGPEPNYGNWKLSLRIVSSAEWN